MSYFKKFPIVKNYQLQDNDYTVVNVTKRGTNIINPEFEKPQFYIDYIVQEGETPVQIADKVYDDADLAWVVLHYNRIIDFYAQWPMEQEALRRFVEAKYDDPYEPHHYESIQSGNRVQQSHIAYDRRMVTNFEYEITENDEKRKIRLLRDDALGEYVRLHDDIAERI